MPSTNKQNLLQLCNQLHQTVNQMENGIKGRRKRNRKSGAAVRSRKSHKRKVAAAVSANAFTNARLDGTSTNLITPKTGSNNQPIIGINAKVLFDADADVDGVAAGALVLKVAKDKAAVEQHQANEVAEDALVSKVAKDKAAVVQHQANEVSEDALVLKVAKDKAALDQHKANKVAVDPPG